MGVKIFSHPGVSAIPPALSSPSMHHRHRTIAGAQPSGTAGADSGSPRAKGPPTGTPPASAHTANAGNSSRPGVLSSVPESSQKQPHCQQPLTPSQPQDNSALFSAVRVSASGSLSGSARRRLSGNDTRGAPSQRMAAGPSLARQQHVGAPPSGRSAGEVVRPRHEEPAARLPLSLCAHSLTTGNPCCSPPSPFPLLPLLLPHLLPCCARAASAPPYDSPSHACCGLWRHPLWVPPLPLTLLALHLAVAGATALVALFDPLLVPVQNSRVAPAWEVVASAVPELIVSALPRLPPRTVSSLPAPCRRARPPAPWYCCHRRCVRPCARARRSQTRARPGIEYRRAAARACHPCWRPLSPRRLRPCHRRRFAPLLHHRLCRQCRRRRCQARAGLPLPAPALALPPPCQ